MRLFRCSTTPAPVQSLFGEPLHEFAAACPTRVSFMAASASGGEPPKPSSASTSPPGAEGSLEQNLREQAELGWHVPSDALKECFPGMCPWCCLQCCHGDVRGALSNFALRENALSADAHRGRFILKQCQMWIIERARLDVQGELQAVMAGTEGAQLSLRPSVESSLQGF